MMYEWVPDDRLRIGLLIVQLCFLVVLFHALLGPSGSRTLKWAFRRQHQIPCPRCGYGLTLPDVPISPGDATASWCAECGLSTPTERAYRAWAKVVGSKSPALEMFFNRSSVGSPRAAES